MAVLLAAGCTGGRAESATSTATTPPSSSTTTLVVVEPLDPAPIDLPAEAFGVGVASGAPTTDSVILWTRFVGELPAEIPLVWEVSSDPDFIVLVATGETVAVDRFGHSVHVDVTGLGSHTNYWYRFRSGDQTSPHGRTKTLPTTRDDVDTIALGFSSCQLFETGHYAAHRDIAESPIDAVVWLGDFIYEYVLGSGTEVRLIDGPEAVSLNDYRARYTQYRRDELLRLSAAAHPWFCTWDDHEVVNDYDQSVDPTRQLAGYQAWWENMPVRLSAPIDESPSIYHSAAMGDLVNLIVLDCRQDATAEHMLSDAQWEWFEARLGEPAVWTIVASSVLVSGTGVSELDDDLIAYTWGGHPTDRDRLAAALKTVRNPILVSGDMHTAMELSFLPTYDLSEESLAHEFMAPAISSPFWEQYVDLAPLLTLLSPTIDYIEPTNGWLELELSATELRPTFHFVDDVADAASPITRTERAALTAR